MITFIFRRRTSGFSIENLFEALFDKMKSAGVNCERVELPYVSSSILSVLRNAWFVLLRRKRGILHITGDAHYAALLCLTTKTVITVHDCVTLQRGTGLKRFVLWLLWFRLPLRMASKITVVSDQTKSELLRNVSIPEKKISVIPNFLRAELQFSTRPFNYRRPRILHVGTNRNKNLPRVISALRELPCTLVIVGRLDSTLLRDLQENNLEYEHYVGIDHDTMTRLYGESDIVSFPSTYEGFGMPILEGQAVGRPVLTSDLEPMRSVAGAGGALLVNPHSEADIRTGFLTLFTDSALRERLIAAGRKNCERYTLDSVAARYLAVYKSLF